MEGYQGKVCLIQFNFEELLFEHCVPAGANEQELATPILSLYHGIFTD